MKSKKIKKQKLMENKINKNENIYNQKYILLIIYKIFIYN